MGDGHHTDAMNGDIMMGKCSRISVVSLLCYIVYFLSSFGLANGFGHWLIRKECDSIA